MTRKRVSQLLASVKIDRIEGRMGQQFKQELEDRLNPGENPSHPNKDPYRLSVALTE